MEENTGFMDKLAELVANFDIANIDRPEAPSKIRKTAKIAIYADPRQDKQKRPMASNA